MNGAKSLTTYMVARFDAVGLFIFFLILWTLQYNRILLCGWVPGCYCVNLRTCAGHNTFVLHLALARVGL